MAASTSDRYVNARQLAKELSSWLGGDRVRALSEAGGKAAAVETARRAVRTHLVTTVWLLVGLGLGVLLAFALAKPGATPASTRVSDAEQDIELLKQNLDGLRRVAENLTAVERNRLWKSLDTRASEIARRLEEEPDVASVQAVRGQLDYVRSIFAPPRVRLDVPADVSMTAQDLVTGAKLAVQRGENQLPPGAYLVSGSGGLSFPLDVPLWIRNQQEAEKVALEAPLETLSLSVSPSTAPQGMVLVLGGRVLARDLPFHTPSTAATTVPAFFMDVAEVTNSEYAQFLHTLPVPERKTRGPRVGFVPDPEQDGAPIVIKGLEDMPVTGITPADARAYAAWLSKKRGANVRLPNEAEWVLAAGATMGHDLANGASGERNEAEFVAPLRSAGEHVKDVSPYGVKGLLGNAREMVTSYLEDLKDAAVLVKGAGVGDDPDQGAIYIHRVLKGDEFHGTTGFRCVQDIPGAQPPR
jgi:formylglycine-generating enzyme required for sulfatase activity